ncbi:hypothetical protein PULV_a2980 [Pseudoalteromonas ulvae UL12]|nr:hypothetical protein [Pseudoalteromonas ulvae UL12]
MNSVKKVSQLVLTFLITKHHFTFKTLSRYDGQIKHFIKKNDEIKRLNY